LAPWIASAGAASVLLRPGDGAGKIAAEQPMTYRGIVNNGVVVLEEGSPEEGTVVEVTPVDVAAQARGGLADHPAVGMWKDRTDLPADAVEASKLLRERLMRRVDE
jgi:hypothetical protein